MTTLSSLEDVYTFVDPLPDKYLCGICKSVLSEPHVTECCGQHFCKDCIEKSKPQSGENYLRKDTNCPHCRQSNFNHIRYLPLKREIGNLKVLCPRQFIGCSIELDYSDRNRHEKVCEYKSTPCTNKCGKVVLRKDLLFHTQHQCELRKCTCEMCGEIEEYRKIQNFEHLLSCPEVSIECTNLCGERFKRKQADFYNSICPEATVTCDFAEAGCQATLKRKDLDSHMETDMKKHLSLLMTAHIAMKQDFKDLQEKYEEYTYKQVAGEFECAVSHYNNKITIVYNNSVHYSQPTGQEGVNKIGYCKHSYIHSLPE